MDDSAWWPLKWSAPEFETSASVIAAKFTISGQEILVRKFDDENFYRVINFSITPWGDASYKCYSLLEVRAMLREFVKEPLS